jgi:small-conductance mechanosensitive channel
MEVLDTMLAGQTLRQWLLAAAAGLAALVLLRLLRRVALARLGAVARRTENRVDDALVEVLAQTRRFFIGLLALEAAAAMLTLSAPVRTGLHVALVIGVALQLAIWGTVAITRLFQARAERTGLADPAAATTLSGVSYVVRLAFYAVLLLLTLDNLGINVTALVAGLGIGGVAIALAVQNILGDLFASLSIVLDKPFLVGDFIIVGDLMGTVEHIGLKTTRVRSLTGEQLVFANSDLLSSRIRNFKRMAERRVLFTVGVTYQTPADQLAAIPGMLKEIVTAEEGVRFDRAHFRSCDDSALTFEIVYYVLDPDYNRYMDIQQRINLALVRRFEQENISFAYPTQTVFLVPSAAA